MPNSNPIYTRISFTYLILMHLHHSHPSYHLQHHPNPPPLITLSSPTNTPILITINSSFNHPLQIHHQYRINMISHHIYPIHPSPSSYITKPTIPSYTHSSNTLNTITTGIWMICPDINIHTCCLADITSITKAFSCIDMVIQMQL